MLAHIIEKVKQRMTERHLTIQWVSDESKVPASTISRILSGRTDNPSVQNLVAICCAVGVSLDELFGLAAPRIEPEPLRIETKPEPAPQPVVDHSAELAAMYKDQLAVKDAWIRRLFCACVGLAGALTALALVAMLF